MTIHLGTLSILCLVSALFLVGCGPDTGAAGTSYSNTDPNPATPCDAGGTAQAGAACVTDCDCCSRICANYTNDAGTSRICTGDCEASK
jgi:hypothetical protein